jgi:KDO2-lipid IV(A) lauroyltransferase
MSWKKASVSVISRLLRPGARAGCAAAVLSSILKIIGPRRRVAGKNLNIVLPGEPREKIKRLVNETYNHLTWVGIEFIVLQRDPRQVLEWVTPENAHILDCLRGKGAILITGHVGNWEIVAAWLAQSGYRLTAIVREPDDIRERGMIEDMRTRVGVECLPKSARMTHAVSLLKRGDFLGVLPDQYGGRNGVKAPFFGVETSTSQGPAVFAYLTGRPLVPVFSHREAPFRHKIRVAPPIAWEKLSTKEETLLYITRLVNESLERMILEAPGQWFAQHRRFRELY